MAAFITLFVSLTSLFSWFSYALTAPNLILTSWSPYWQFQTWMWKTFFNDRPLLTYTYLGILVGWWAVYLAWIWWSRGRDLASRWQYYLLGLGLICVPLFAANNALSYDVFNYIFNAKMVWVYQANPHLRFALEFPQDDWLRFMHNTHTPAPYGYGWTALSLLPYLAGAGKFTLTWIIFRLWSGLSLALLAGGLIWGIRRLLPKADQAIAWRELSLLLLSPLLLIEIISNSHNDLWMLVPAVVSLLLVGKPRQRRWRWWVVLLSLGLLGISISLKLVTVALVPLWLTLGLWHLVVRTGWRRPWPVKHPVSQLLTWFQHALDHWPLVASICLFVPLLTPRSQQFHPWYLTWVLVWLPLVQWRKARGGWWRIFIWTLSLSSLLRYVPYLWAGEYNPLVLSQQLWITWSALPISLAIWAGSRWLGKAWRS